MAQPIDAPYSFSITIGASLVLRGRGRSSALARLLPCGVPTVGSPLVPANPGPWTPATTSTGVESNPPVVITQAPIFGSRDVMGSPTCRAAGSPPLPPSSSLQGCRDLAADCHPLVLVLVVATASQSFVKRCSDSSHSTLANVTAGGLQFAQAAGPAAASPATPQRSPH